MQEADHATFTGGSDCNLKSPNISCVQSSCFLFIMSARVASWKVKGPLKNPNEVLLELASCLKLQRFHEMCEFG